jgi:hypothetical protein
MLVSRKYEKEDVVSFKLVNGDEIVARVEEETEQGYFVSKPTTVMPSQQGIGLIQSLFTGNKDKSVFLSKQHVMFHSPTIKDIENHYITTTTGIQPVTKGSIII